MGRLFPRSGRFAWGLLGLSLVLLWSLALGLTGCQSVPSGAAKDKLQVVATSTILANLAERISPPAIQINGILQPGDDPHVYEPRPADSRLLETADLIFYNGYNLEPGLIKLMESASRAPQVAVGEIIPPLKLEKHQVTVPDPHVWGDAQNVAKMVGLMRDQLTQLTQQHPQASQIRLELRQKSGGLIAELDRLDDWIRTQIQTIPPAQRRLITTHDAFQYYARAYGLKVSGTLIGISTEEQPSAQTTRNLVETVKAQGVPAIFAETTINPSLIRTVAAEAGVKLAEPPLYSDSIGPVGSDAADYIQMMVVNTTTITEALGGKVTPFKTL